MFLIVIVPRIMRLIPKSDPATPKPTAAKRLGVVAKKGGVGGILAWLLDFGFEDIRLVDLNFWFCQAVYVIGWIVAVLVLLFGTLGILFVGVAGIRESGGLSLVMMLIGIPLLWLGVILFIIAVRLALEWEIMLVDWIAETTEAARLYADEKSGTKE